MNLGLTTLAPLEVPLPFHHFNSASRHNANNHTLSRFSASWGVSHLAIPTLAPDIFKEHAGLVAWNTTELSCYGVNVCVPCPQIHMFKF